MDQQIIEQFEQVVEVLKKSQALTDRERKAATLATAATVVHLGPLLLDISHKLDRLLEQQSGNRTTKKRTRRRTTPVDVET